MQNTTVTSLSFSQYFLVQVGDLGKDDVFSYSQIQRWV